MKPPKRPIDAQDMPWSYIGKDALDAAAERLWNNYIPRDAAELPYHLQRSQEQEIVQRGVINILGTTVPALLRQRAKELGSDLVGKTALRDLADELEHGHG